MIHLRDYQQEWFEVAVDNILVHGGYGDTSPTGSGKTYVCGTIAQTFNIDLFVVCPASLIATWNKFAEKENVNLVGIISYQSLRGNNNIYVNRYETFSKNKKGDLIKTVTFEPTARWNDMVSDGIFLACDEIQFVKNANPTYNAVKALMEPIVTTDNESFYSLMSASPFDKEKSAANIVRLIGFVRDKYLYQINSKTGQVLMKGLRELINKCQDLDKELTDEIMARRNISKNTVDNIVYMLYTEVVTPALFGGMVRPPDKFDHKIYNGFYKTTPSEQEAISAALTALSKAITSEDHGIFAMSKQLRDLEFAKRGLFVRQAMKVLEREGEKVVVSVNYHDTIDFIASKLVKYEPMIMTGKTPMEERTDVIDFFNTDPEKRCLIMTTQTGNVGISLHNTIDSYARTMVISPSYHMISIYQASGRLNRLGVTSNTEVKIVYANRFSEMGIFESLRKKSSVVKSTLTKELQQNATLFCDIPSKVPISSNNTINTK